MHCYYSLQKIGIFSTLWHFEPLSIHAKYITGTKEQFVRAGFQNNVEQTSVSNKILRTCSPWMPNFDLTAATNGSNKVRPPQGKKLFCYHKIKTQTLSKINWLGATIHECNSRNNWQHILPRQSELKSCIWFRWTSHARVDSMHGSAICTGKYSENSARVLRVKVNEKLVRLPSLWRACTSPFIPNFTWSFEDCPRKRRRRFSHQLFCIAGLAKSSAPRNDIAVLNKNSRIIIGVSAKMMNRWVIVEFYPLCIHKKVVFVRSARCQPSEVHVERTGWVLIVCLELLAEK